MESKYFSGKQKIAAGQLVKEREYWMNKLSGERERSYFPYDYNYKNPTTGEYARKTRDFKISGKFQARLKEITGGLYPKIHIIMTAALAALLARYTGNRDITLGTSIDRQEIEGELINTILPLRILLPVHITFKELILEVRMVIKEAIAHQNYPIETLLPGLGDFSSLHGEELGQESQFPLFDVVVLLENLQERKYVEHLQTSMNFFFRATDDEIEGKVEYNTSKYSEESVKKIIEHLLRFMRTALDEAHLEIRNIQLLSREDKEALARFNRTRAEYPHQKTIHELFTLQVEKTPGSTALIENENHGNTRFVSYQQLNERVNRWTRFLAAQGAKPGDIIGILMEPSLELVSAIMAILKSGCAFLPLDIDYPEERKSYMLKDSRALLLLTRKARAEIRGWNGRILDVEDIDLPGDSRDDGGMPGSAYPRVYPSSLAYVIYTSGSTGKPKGVAVEHRALVNYVWWAAKIYIKNEKVNFPLYTSIAFDLTITSLFTPLITGNTIYIYRGENKEFLVEKVFRENKVEAVKLTPVHLMLMADKKGEGSSIKRFIVGGERLETSLAQKAYDNFDGNIEIYNEYGPTEAAVGCMIYKFNPQKDKGASIPIGSPADNVQIYLLDRYNREVVKGGVGELYISGDGLARGYLNKPALTAQRFVPNRFMPGKTVFRTGDMARRLVNGMIEFLGRVDQQVKIRGYRIEIGEVENWLSAHESIDQAVVAVNDDESGYKYLAAYIVLSGGMSQRDFDVQELRNFLLGYLPEFMIPAFFVPIESLPLTINGKVDRKALPAPCPDSPGTDNQYKAPENEVEQVMVKVWQEVFNVQPIGVTDNYFSLGGDSIKAIQLSARLLNFHLKVSIADFFSNPTIQQLVKKVKKTPRVINQGLVQGNVELTPIQQWFFHQFYDPEKPDLIRHFNQSLMLYKSDGFDEHMVKKVFARIVQHHDALRMVYKIEEKEVTQVNRGLEGTLFDLEVIPCRDIRNIEKEANRIQGGMNLSEGPLVKLGLFKTSHGDHLLIAVHHLVMDGVSGRILLEDFISGYQQAEKGEKLKFPTKTDSFRDWAHRLKDYSTAPSILNQLEYWEKIEKIKPEPLPPDYEYRGTNNKGHRKWKNRDQVLITLNKKETSKLLKEVNRAYNTEINDILLTVLSVVIHRWANIEKILINLEGHGREDIMEGMDISRTLGWYTAQYPVLFDMTQANISAHKPGKDNQYISRCIKLVKDTLRCIPGKGIGYGILKYLTPREKKEDPGLAIQPEIGFNYLGQFDQTRTNQNYHHLFQFSPIQGGDNINPELQSTYKLELTGSVIDGVLSLGIGYNKGEYKRNTIQKLADDYRDTLICIIEHCMKKEDSEATLSDFTSTDLDMEEMAAIVDELEDEFNQ